MKKRGIEFLFKKGLIIHLLRCGFVFLWGVVLGGIPNLSNHIIIVFLIFIFGGILERICRHYVIYKANELGCEYTEELRKWMLRRIYFDVKKLPIEMKPYLNEYYSVIGFFAVLIVLLVIRTI